MKTLLTFVDELIKFLPNKKTTHLLEIDEFTLTNFRFNGFIKKESELKFKSKNLTHLIKFLIYFEFIKENKKTFFQHLYSMQYCTLITFFTGALNFHSDIFTTKNILLKINLNKSLKKLLIGVLVNKKINELKKTVMFWNIFNLKLLNIDILHQSFQEIVLKKIFEQIKTIFSFKKHHPYIFKKRWGCFFMCLNESDSISKKKSMVNSYPMDLNFFPTFLLEIKKFLTTKKFKILLDLIRIYLFRNKEVSKFVPSKLLNIFSNYKKIYLHQICGQKLHPKKRIAEKSFLMKKKSSCLILNGYITKEKMKKRSLIEVEKFFYNTPFKFLS